MWMLLLEKRNLDVVVLYMIPLVVVAFNKEFSLEAFYSNNELIYIYRHEAS
jgi:hypothetical protein